MADKIKKILVVMVLFLGLALNTTSVWANTSANLHLTKGNTYLLVFDDRIMSSPLFDKSKIDLEVIDSIFDGKNQIIVKPKQLKSTAVLFKGMNDTYNFQITVKDEESDSYVDNDADMNFQVMLLDLPPTRDFSDTEIDLPPTI